MGEAEGAGERLSLGSGGVGVALGGRGEGERVGVADLVGVALGIKGEGVTKFIVAVALGGTGDRPVLGS